MKFCKSCDNLLYLKITEPSEESTDESESSSASVDQGLEKKNVN